MIAVDKVIEIFCIADDFCREYSSEVQKHQVESKDGKKRRNRPCSLSDSEIVAILVCFHFGTFHNFKHYYLFFIKKQLQSYFPTAVSYNRFVELESRVAIPMILMLKLLCFGECTGITYVDITCIPCVITNGSSVTKFSKMWLRLGKAPWVGIMVSNCIWFVMTKENY